MKKFLVSVLLTFVISHAFGQKLISGKVKNEKGESLPYANIGIKGGKIGTVSEIDGKFSLTVADSVLKDSLTFSSIGFKDKTLLISSLIRENVIVVLEEKVISLAEVKINTTKTRLHKLGITGRTPMIYVPSKSFQKNDIIEQARLIHLKAPAKIMDANIFVMSASMEEVSIRLNFYALKNGLPGRRLIEKSIIRKAAIKNGWFKVDLTDEDIYLDEDFVVAFEYLPSNQSTIVFAAKLGSADSFLRNSSQGLWRRNQAAGCSIYVTAAW